MKNLRTFESFINEGAFVVWYEDQEGKHLLGTFHNKRAAEKYKSEEEDEVLNTKGVESIGTMSKDMWDKKEAPYIKETVNEKMVSPKRGHNYYKLYRDTPIKYISGRSGMGLEVPGVLLHNEYDTIKGQEGAYIIDYFGAYFYVDMENKFALKIVDPHDKGQDKNLIKNIGRATIAPAHSDWKDFLNEAEVNEGSYKHMPELIELLSDIDAMEMDPEEFIDQMVQYYELDADTAGDLFDAYWSLGAKDRFHFKKNDWEKFLKKHGIK
jgi:hypothetical protein